MGYFLPYQQRWINDDSPLKLYEKSRRVGITYGTSYRAVRKCLRQKDGSSFIQWVSSRDELTAKSFVTDYVAYWAKEANAVARGLDGQETEVVDEKHGITAFVVRFKNGAKICSLSSNPLAFAGKGGDILIDEMDLHLDQETLYAMAYPCITWGDQLEIVSAYSADGTIHTQFAQLCKEAKLDNPKGFSFHRTTLDDAINEGFVEKVNEVKRAKGRTAQSREEFRAAIRKGCINQAAFDSQYMCIPNETRGSQFIQMSDLAAATSDFDCFRHHAEKNLPDYLTTPEFWFGLLCKSRKKRYFFGYDIARSGDLSSVWVNSFDGKISSLAALITLADMKFEAQKQLIRALLKCGIPGAGDSTGLGMAICEELADEFSGSFVGVNFGAAKMALGTMLQGAFESGTQLIPAALPEVKYDLAAIQKDSTVAGRLILTAAKNELLPQSHCDIAWSCALALYAQNEFAGGPCNMEPARSTGRNARADDFDNPRRIDNEIQAAGIDWF